MDKIRILVFAVFALSAFAAGSASAALTFELALWLNNGADINAELLVISEGSLLFLNELKSAGFLCSGLFEGTVGPESLDLVTMVYDLVGNLVEELDEEGATNGVSCESISEICETGTEIWPLHLPFLTEVEQDSETGLFYELTFSGGNGPPGYFLLCLFLGGSIDELCELNEGVEHEVLNVAGGVEGMGVVSPRNSCGGNAEDGLIEFDAGNLTLLVTEGPLSISLP